jgi:hypothetical protein
VVLANAAGADSDAGVPEEDAPPQAVPNIKNVASTNASDFFIGFNLFVCIQESL